MNSRSDHRAVVWIVSLVLVVGACGEPAPEKLLERSRKIPELYQFGTLYIPLYQQAVADSDWTAIRQGIREIVRLKQLVNRQDVPDNIILRKQEWESNQRLFSRAVDNLSVVMGWTGARADLGRIEIAEGVQSVYDWWQMLVEMVR